MVANLKNMSRMFWDCNKKYFNNSLPTPKMDIFSKKRTFGQLVYRMGMKKGKKVIVYSMLYFTDYYDFTEKEFEEIMVHELIHLYIAHNNIKDNKSHGKFFTKMANDINEKYGLNIMESKSSSSFKKNEQRT